MVSDQMYTWSRNERSQALDKRERVEYEVRSAIAPWPAQLIDDLAIRREGEALGRDRASGYGLRSNRDARGGLGRGL